MSLTNGPIEEKLVELVIFATWDIPLQSKRIFPMESKKYLYKVWFRRDPSERQAPAEAFGHKPGWIILLVLHRVHTLCGRFAKLLLNLPQFSTILARILEVCPGYRYKRVKRKTWSRFRDDGTGVPGRRCLLATRCEGPPDTNLISILRFGSVRGSAKRIFIHKTLATSEDFALQPSESK